MNALVQAHQSPFEAIYHEQPYWKTGLHVLAFGREYSASSHAPLFCFLGAWGAFSLEKNTQAVTPCTNEKIYM